MKQFFQKYGTQLFVFLFWLTILSGFWLYAKRADLTPLEIVQEMIRVASATVWGPIIYIVAYTIRPLTLIPSTFLSVAAGYLFGPYFGMLYAVLGSNASASADYLIAYLIGKDIINPEESDNKLLKKYTKRMRENSFETILIMRLTFLPYDTVSWFAGFLRIRYWAFALATFLGGVAGTLSFVLFGASIEGEFTGQLPEFQPWTLAMAGALFVLSLIVSRLVRQREAGRETAVKSVIE